MVVPVRNLLKKALYVWTRTHQEALDRIKEAASNPQHLAFVVPGAQLILRTDASMVGIGGILTRRLSCYEEEQIVMLFGRVPTDTESRYATMEQEALAILFCLEKAEFIINGPGLVGTDHFNLRNVCNSQNPRVQR